MNFYRNVYKIITIYSNKKLNFLTRYELNMNFLGGKNLKIHI